MDTEFESFKRGVSLVDVAVNSFGFEFDKRDSCRSSTVLRLGDEKLVVRRHSSGAYDTYFGREEGDRGTVIDLVFNRVFSENKHLVPVRQLLRGYIPNAKRPAERRVAKDLVAQPVVVAKDLEAIQAYESTLKSYTGTYLTEERGLSDYFIRTFFPVGVGQ
jgi:hypothetical protein